MHPTGRKIQTSTLVRCVLTLPLLAAWFCLPANARPQSLDAANGFSGRWDLTIHDPHGDYPSWIEVRPQGSAVTVTFVGRIGSAEQLPEAALLQGVLTFTAPAENSWRGPQRYRAVLKNKSLIGTLEQQGEPEITWTGRPAPSLLHSSEIRWGQPQTLFDGKGLAGWHFSSGQHGNWTVAKGVLTSTGRGADVLTDRTFQDLQLHLEWRCSPRANSGVYLRGRYEVQIETDSSAEPPSHHTGGVYGFLAPHPEQPRQPDTWQSFDLTLIGRRITVVQNGTVILDDQPIPGITGGALDSDEAAPGPILLQGGEDGTVQFRNIQIRLPQTQPAVR